MDEIKERFVKGNRGNMMEKRTISFSPPDITELEIAEVAEALRSGWIWWILALPETIRFLLSCESIFSA